jgi:hypothetical protein
MNEKRQFREAVEPCTGDMPRQTGLKALHSRVKRKLQPMIGGDITR